MAEAQVDLETGGLADGLRSMLETHDVYAARLAELEAQEPELRAAAEATLEPLPTDGDHGTVAARVETRARWIECRHMIDTYQANLNGNSAGIAEQRRLLEQSQ